MSAGRPPLDVSVGERLELARPHPCGSSVWVVTRLGADIGLRCEGCGRRVMLERPVLERRLRARLDKAADA